MRNVMHAKWHLWVFGVFVCLYLAFAHKPLDTKCVSFGEQINQSTNIHLPSQRSNKKKDENCC